MRGLMHLFAVLAEVLAPLALAVLLLRLPF